MNQNGGAGGAPPTNTWERYLTDYNEGLGLVYERFVLNDFLEDLRRRHNIQSVLEAPLYGMAGVSGTSLPGRMAEINEVLNALPVPLRERLLVEYLNVLYRH